MSIANGDFLLNQIYINNTGAKKIYKGTDLVYDRSLKNKFEYFYIYASSGVDQGIVGTVSLENNGGNAPDVEYSRDGINWTTWDYSSLDLYNPTEFDEDPIKYDFIFFRGNNPNGFSSSTSVYSRFRIIDNLYGQAYITIGGNIMSLLYKDSFWKEDISPNDTIPNDYCFYRLFYQSDIHSCLGGPGSYNDYDVGVFRLPAMNLTANCYNTMFGSCRKLLYGPRVLPAKKLKNSCYSNMFNGCYPDYHRAPLLPATELANFCYNNMFYWCTGLNYVKTTTTNFGSYMLPFTAWLKNVSSTGTFVKKAGVTFPAGESGIPSGWTVEEV